MRLARRARSRPRMSFGHCSIHLNSYLIIDMARMNINCDGLTRRDFIQVGLTSVVGLGLCDLLRLRAVAAGNDAVSSVSAAKNVNCILIWLDGGPSHYESFDPKPDAPSEIRGEFKTIPTKIPGVHFSECVSQLAK